LRVWLLPSKRENEMLCSIKVWAAQKTSPLGGSLRSKVIRSRSRDDREMRQVRLCEADGCASQFSGIAVTPDGWLDLIVEVQYCLTLPDNAPYAAKPKNLGIRRHSERPVAKAVLLPLLEPLTQPLLAGRQIGSGTIGAKAIRFGIAIHLEKSDGVTGSRTAQRQPFGAHNIECMCQITGVAICVVRHD
jgi:hypothetical protein